MSDDGHGVVPMLSYADAPAAMDWLQAAFGFTEVARWLDDEGRLSHGELETGRGWVMLATPSPDYEPPGRHRRGCAAADRWLSVPWVVDGVLVEVDDVRLHRARAVEHGARPLSEVEAGPGGRLYRVEDLEGHRWMFLQPDLA